MDYLGPFDHDVSRFLYRCYCAVQPPPANMPSPPAPPPVAPHVCPTSSSEDLVNGVVILQTGTNTSTGAAICARNCDVAKVRNGVPGTVCQELCARNCVPGTERGEKEGNKAVGSVVLPGLRYHHHTKCS